MIEIARKLRNTSLLKQLHSAYRDQFEAVLWEMSLGGRPRLQDGWRSTAEQRRHFAAGRSQVATAGPHCNVVVVDGRERPASLAVHVLDDDAPLAPSHEWMARLAVVAARHRLQTGLGWARKLSSPLAFGSLERTLLDTAVRNGDILGVMDVLREVGPGEDPLHVEVPRWRELLRAPSK